MLAEANFENSLKQNYKHIFKATANTNINEYNSIC